jgi:hypothetical protein
MTVLLAFFPAAAPTGLGKRLYRYEHLKTVNGRQPFGSLISAMS